MSTVQAPNSLAKRDVGVWRLTSSIERHNQFVDVRVRGRFTAPDGRILEQDGFHNGGDTWVVRFSPDVAGSWTWEIWATPDDRHLSGAGAIEVAEREVRGHVRVTPDRNWGFSYEDGSPALTFGDTVYNLFAMAHCGYDVDAFLERRREQGFTMLRVRVPVSPFHPETAVSEWQHRRCLPWEGVEQYPIFDRFNLDWFATVDHVVQRCEKLGLGLELIMEAWGFEFPFNSRTVFTPEHEDLWMRYLVARYDAYSCVWMWTPMNEYENYPHGHPIWTPEADRWLLRMADLIGSAGAHQHIVAAHNGPPTPAFAKRFAAAPEKIGAVMFQEWGSFGKEDGWLAAGIEESMERSFRDWPGARVLAEWGYERNPDLALAVPWHEHMGVEHTRRGAWRGVFCAAGLVHGFENTWGPWCELAVDQPGMEQLLHVHRFLVNVVDFTHLRPVTGLFNEEQAVTLGHAVRALASDRRDTVAAYLPVGGRLTVPAELQAHVLQWYDPRSGELIAATISATVAPPASGDTDDWVALFTE